MSERTEFMIAVRGLSAWAAARALNRLTPGVNWRGSTKGNMSIAWAERATARYSLIPANRTIDQLNAAIAAETDV